MSIKPARLFVGRTAAIALLAMLAPACAALTARAEASLDWSALAFDFLEGNADLQDEETSVVALIGRLGRGVTPRSFREERVNDWTSPVLLDDVLDDPDVRIGVSGRADAAMLSAQVTLENLVAGAFAGRQSSAFLSRSAQLRATATGTLLVSVPYAVNASTNDQSPLINAVAAFGAVRFGAGDSAFNVSYQSYASLLVGSDSFPTEDAESGTLTLAIPLRQGDTFNLSGWVNATITDSSAVPVPPLIGCVGASLAALCAQRRRRPALSSPGRKS